MRFPSRNCSPSSTAEHAIFGDGQDVAVEGGETPLPVYGPGAGHELGRFGQMANRPRMGEYGRVRACGGQRGGSTGVVQMHVSNDKVGDAFRRDRSVSRARSSSGTAKRVLFSTKATWRSPPLGDMRRYGAARHTDNQS